MISLKNISKRFEATWALKNVSLELHPGERLALVGENGAGKSTLMNVLVGLYAPEEGALFIDGAVRTWKGPHEARARGIGMVHQHFMLVPNLTVAENVVLGREPTRNGLFDFETACAQVEETARKFGFQIDARTKVDGLTVGSRQKVEILKALWGGSRILILDEPTSVLTVEEAEELFSVTKALSEKGHTVVLISHKLSDVMRFATRIAVMRKGEKVFETRPEDTTEEILAGKMMGAARPPPAVYSRRRPGLELLSLKGLGAASASGRGGLGDVTLSVHQGERVGIAGVDGNGQRELAEVLSGLRPWQSGQLWWKGERVSALSPRTAREKGIAHIPEDRHHRAIIADMTVEENLSLGRQRQASFAKGGRIDFSARRAFAEKRISDFDIRPQTPKALLKELSGGNQQKVVLARETERPLQLLLAVQPTRGLDLGATDTVHRQMCALSEEGTAVLLISLDLDEVLALCDRVYVLFEGRIRGAFARDDFDARRIGRLMLGATA